MADLLSSFPLLLLRLGTRYRRPEWAQQSPSQAETGLRQATRKSNKNNNNDQGRFIYIPRVTRVCSTTLDDRNRRDDGADRRDAVAAAAADVTLALARAEAARAAVAKLLAAILMGQSVSKNVGAKQTRSVGADCGAQRVRSARSDLDW